MQIGQRGQSTGNTDMDNVHQPADVFVARARRTSSMSPTATAISASSVFDTNNGKFKRMWSAFGNAPTPAMAPNPPTPQPNQAGPRVRRSSAWSHAVKVSRDGVVYVADRTNNRIQMLHRRPASFCGRRVSRSEAAVVPVPAGFAFSPDRQAAVPLRRRFGTDAGGDLRSAVDDADRHDWHARSEARRVRHRPPHGRRLEGQPVHGGDRHEPPRTAIHAEEVAA